VLELECMFPLLFWYCKTTAGANFPHTHMSNCSRLDINLNLLQRCV